MKRIFAVFCLLFISSTVAHAAQSSNKDLDFVSNVVRLIKAAQLGKTIHVNGDFGVKVREGLYTGVDLKGPIRTEISLVGDNWRFELPTYVWQKDFSQITVDGQAFNDLVQGDRIGLSDQDRKFIRNITYLIKASNEGKLIHANGSFGTKLREGLYSGVDLKGPISTEISLVDGKWSFELPTYVWQNDFSNILVDGKPMASAGKLIGVCGGALSR